MRILIRALCGVTPNYISCNEFLLLCNINEGLSSQLKRYAIAPLSELKVLTLKWRFF